MWTSSCETCVRLWLFIFCSSISISPHGLDCKPTRCKMIYHWIEPADWIPCYFAFGRFPLELHSCPKILLKTRLFKHAFRPDSIDLLFLRSSCMFMKWETDIYFFLNRNFLSNYCIFMQMFASFSFYFPFYPSLPFQMGLGKIRETTNELSLALAINLFCDRLF